MPDMTIPTLLERLARLLQNESHHEGLKPVQWEVLRYLARANRFSRSPSALTAYLGLTKGTVSQTLNALERKGLVDKESGLPDRRQIRLCLSEAGHQAVSEDPISALLETERTLTTDQKEALRHGLTVLLSEALRQRGGRPFGLCRNCQFFETGMENGQHFCRLLKVGLESAEGAQICHEQIPRAS